MTSPLKKLLDDSIESTIGPVVKDLTRRHRRGANTVKRVLGFYVCNNCNHSQIKQFACCPKCRHPHPGLFVKKT